MAHANKQHEATPRLLTEEQLAHVSGGMKWQPVANPDVIDARGGQFTLLWWTFTLDVSGHISSSS